MINETAICEFHSSCLELRQTIYVTIYNLLLDADHSAVSFKKNWLEYFVFILEFLMELGIKERNMTGSKEKENCINFLKYDLLRWSFNYEPNFSATKIPQKIWLHNKKIRKKDRKKTKRTKWLEYFCIYFRVSYGT